ncbi:hypothetical protein ABEB36_006950 [Hypothenemus hampei]|uniref:CLIP domain-containing serine protease n=1 Tax=Hypothenemus hampei TaxID=57062 RepID=A0ABD1ES99_HYPHA
MLLRTIIFCFPLFLSVSSQWREQCRTPDRRIGVCVSLYECTPILDFAGKIKRPVPQEIMQYLRSFSCQTGQSSNIDKVCCPPGPIVFQQQTNENQDILPKNCGYFSSNNRIVNGEDAALNEFPWMALIKYRTSRGRSKFLCGGSIIHKNYILTAAHCLTGEIISVRVGEHDLRTEIDCEVVNKTRKCSPPVQEVSVEKIIAHPDFSRQNLRNDIGLIRVSTIHFNEENIRPICLPQDDEKTKLFDAVYVAGWGVIDSVTRVSSNVLQKVRLPIASKANCSAAYRENNIQIIDSQLCAGGVDERDSCSGDSGGPMMVPTIREQINIVFVQQGVVSFGMTFCGTPGFPGVYTRVSYFMDWILDNMRP